MTTARRMSLGVLLLVSWATAAAADPVMLTSGQGSLYQLGDLAGVELGGPGLHLLGEGRGSFGPISLTAGVPATFHASFTVGSRGFKQFQTVNGVTYDVFLRGWLSFSGQPFIVPPVAPPDFRSFSMPMTMTGHIDGFSTFDGETPVFSVDVMGSGGMSFGPFRILDPDAHTWTAIHASGGFVIEDRAADPVPEPATMILLGTGLAAASVRTRRRRVLRARAGQCPGPLDATVH